MAEKTTIRCILFGHKNGKHGASYMKLMLAKDGAGYHDGIGREHVECKATCIRCGEQFSAGWIHLPQRKEPT